MIEEQQQQQQQNANYTKDLAEDPKSINARYGCLSMPWTNIPMLNVNRIYKIAGSVYIEICCKGYAAMRWRGKTLCRPVCDNCQNGRCIAPGVCECYEEFVANE
ncbi:hypothetical protein DOY81_014635 [Sarcophaga bullata]|nr:hypothetical protein DOY81_014635 [Sarcophaga bullata]